MGFAVRDSAALCQERGATVRICWIALHAVIVLLAVILEDFYVVTTENGDLSEQEYGMYMDVESSGIRNVFVGMPCTLTMPTVKNFQITKM